MTLAPAVMWHDVECGSYTADLWLWDELAVREPGPILDVGAGTGRVALRLARAGHELVALDRDPDLLAALAERARAAGIPVGEVTAGEPAPREPAPAGALQLVTADAAGFDLGPRRFGLVLVPMQTIQLLPGPAARAGFLAAARRHLRPGGLLAATIADALEGFDSEHTDPPAPDVAERDGWRFVSQPVAVRELPAALRIERIRHAVAPGGERTAEGDAVELARITTAELEAEGRAASFTPERPRRIPETDEHVGSDVVMLRG